MTMVTNSMTQYSGGSPSRIQPEMPSRFACLLVAASALVLIPMAGCYGCGDASTRMTGTILAPSDASTVTILVGRTTLRVPRNARFANLGGGNYDGYIMEYQTFAGKSLHGYVQGQFDLYTQPDASQHPAVVFDDARHRATLTYDLGDNSRHMQMFQDLGDGGALTLEADYTPGGEPSALSALTQLINDVVPVRPGEPIPRGMGMGDSVLVRSTLNGEVANAFLDIPLPGYDINDQSGFRIEIVSEMSSGVTTDDLNATCHNGQLMQYDLGNNMAKSDPPLFTTDLLRYRERIVAGTAGGETVDVQTLVDGGSRLAHFTYMSDPVYPPAGQPSITIRATAEGMQKSNDLRQTLAVWDSILASATVVPMPAPARGLLTSAYPGYKPLPPCRLGTEVNLASVSGASGVQRKTPLRKTR